MNEVDSPLVDDSFDENFRVWEIIPGEPDKAYAAFSAYRDIPPYERSIDKCYRTLTGNKGRASGGWRTWSRKFSWQDRVMAFDKWKSRESSVKEINQVSQVKEEIIDMTRKMRNMIMKKFEAMMESEEDIPINVIAQWMKIAPELELMALGEPTRGRGIVNTPAQSMQNSDATRIEVVFKDASGSTEAAAEMKQFIEENTASPIVSAGIED